MLSKTRSDLILEVARWHEKTACGPLTGKEIDASVLIDSMHKKIEAAYQIVFALENDSYLKELGQKLREALEL